MSTNQQYQSPSLQGHESDKCHFYALSSLKFSLKSASFPGGRAASGGEPHRGPRQRRPSRRGALHRLRLGRQPLAPRQPLPRLVAGTHTGPHLLTARETFPKSVQAASNQYPAASISAAENTGAGHWILTVYTFANFHTFARSARVRADIDISD